jgi:hypothetical protein
VSDHIEIQPVQPGDGSDLAERWIEFGRYYASRDPTRFRVPGAEGLAQWFDSRIEEESDYLWLVAERSGGSSRSSKERYCLLWRTRIDN